MKITRINSLLISAFALVVILLISITWLSWESNQRQQRDDEWVLHTYEVISQIEGVFSLSRDGQIDARNYATTGNASYLTSFEQIRKTLPLRLDSLEQMMPPGSIQYRKLQALRPLLLQRLGLNQQLVEKVRQGRVTPVAAEAMLTQGRVILNKARPAVAELVGIERQLIVERKALALSTHRNTQRLIIMSALASLCLIGIVFLMLRRELLQRVKNEQKLRLYEVSLQEQLVNEQSQNQHLEELNQALRLSNDNLEQFAYAASHDLQEPLRKIQAFGNLLRDQYGQSLGEEGTDLLLRMEAAASRMQSLIRDLLTYSRITTHAGQSQRIVLNQLMNQVLNDLEWSTEQHEATVRVGELPVIDGFPHQMSQLFQNLINNSLKFRKKDEKPEISINSRPLAPHEHQSWMNGHADQYVCIEVKDNGIGFEPKYSDRIFQLFQRLHGRDKYPGTGVGLALCKKVVENHKGQIRAVGEPQKGAAFLIYLPVA
ncbi:sensor histidine kinase [Arsenicibacter rosenii]|uniref:histidine kinase n=1 Tax=Arsenicibacter rosenii TaxID=1750698 RepID=A0A1S2VH24_9BACT|nr:sensor histidine kinase [Arsenicibacter rosenii]OIN58024.1 hypothetical protein BLX24_15935 [Arsenicibacter rosenii]